MTETQEARVQFSESQVVTPTLRRTARRSLFWIVIALILVIFAVVSLLAIGVAPSTARLSATNPRPNGAEALISVLRTDGVDTRAPRTLKAAIADASVDVPATTVVIYDPTSILSSYQLGTLGAVAPNLVLIEPSKRDLSALAPGVSLAGAVPSTANADCGYAPVRRAGNVSGLADGYRVSGGGASVQRCLGSSGVYALVRSVYTNQTVTVLGSTTALTNQSIVDKGNAALALGVFGSTKRLVWYLPSFPDKAGVVADGVLPAPPWVVLTAILLGLVVVAAGVWRGRRLGPVVVERMPVTVRASETLEGRARLYQKASAQGHALDALRVGAISRLAVLCGLPTLATVDEVIGAVASVTGRPIAALRALLLDDVPTSDAQLVRLSDGLRLLEDEVARALVPR
jgi:hypothetical protein